MSTILLESGRRPHRSFTSALPSIALHGVVILAAIQMTAHAGLQAAPTQHAPQVKLYPPSGKTTRTPPPAVKAPQAARRTALKTAVLPSPVDPPAVAIAATPLSSLLMADPGSAAVSPAEFQNPSAHPGANFRAGPPSEQVIVDYQIERDAAAIPGSAVPEYPEALRAAGVQGTVLASFIVDTTGHVDAGSVRIIRSDDDRFDAAVERALKEARFTAATVGRWKIRQLVQQSFSFTIAAPVGGH